VVDPRRASLGGEAKAVAALEHLDVRGERTDRMASRSQVSSVTSLTYSIRRPRNPATRATWLPALTGPGVSSRALRTPPIQLVSLAGSRR
jgi:hypothetical protein